MSKYKKAGITRRKFLGSSAALVGGALFNPLPVTASAHVAGSDVLKIALIGSGQRGMGAALNALRADEATELVAIADIFRDKVDYCYEILSDIDQISKRVKVPEEHRLVGLDAYEKAIRLADVVILATPPAFRPLHFEASVQAGKHVFMEKPLSTDAPGARRILEMGKVAEQKGLNVVVGLQYRYAIKYNKVKEQVENGAIGEITSMSSNYLVGGIKQVDRQSGQSELEYQLRNWRHFEWLWGGSSAGLAIHFEDIAHWLKGSYPVRVFGTGGRSGLEGPEHGDIYDNYYIDYEYDDGTRLNSRIRHITGCWQERSLYIWGSEGRIDLISSWGAEIKDLKGKTIWHYKDSSDPSPFQLEHDALFKAIRSGKTVNNTQRGGMSNMASIMGRFAVQSGQRLEWEDAYNSDLVQVPDNLTFDSQAPVLPKENGNYPVMVPGSKTRAF